jgi:hypothetical protein
MNGAQEEALHLLTQEPFFFQPPFSQNFVELAAVQSRCISSLSQRSGSHPPNPLCFCRAGDTSLFWPPAFLLFAPWRTEQTPIDAQEKEI